MDEEGATNGLLSSRKQLATALADAVRDRTPEEAMSNLLGILSHATRTPLHAVAGYADILSTEDNLSDAQREALHSVERLANTTLEAIGLFSEAYVGEFQAQQRAMSPDGPNWATIELPQDLQPLFQEAMSGFCAFARTRGYSLRFSSIVGQEDIHFRFDFDGPNSSVFPEELRSSLQEYIRHLLSDDVLPMDVPLGMSVQDYQAAMAVAEIRLSSLRSQLRIERIERRRLKEIEDKVLAAGPFITADTINLVGGDQARAKMASSSQRTSNRTESLTAIIELADEVSELGLEDVEAALRQVYVELSSTTTNTGKPGLERATALLDRANRAGQLGQKAVDFVQKLSHLLQALG